MDQTNGIAQMKIPFHQFNGCKLQNSMKGSVGKGLDGTTLWDLTSLTMNGRNMNNDVISAMTPL